MKFLYPSKILLVMILMFFMLIFSILMQSPSSSTSLTIQEEDSISIEKTPQKSSKAQLYQTCEDFSSFLTHIREGTMPKDSLKKGFSERMKHLDSLCLLMYKDSSIQQDLFFPVENYTEKSIGGTNGSGYITSGYDFFDGNKHGGHPAHDIFIYDKNQDCIDDLTHKPVAILAYSSGVVVAAQKTWEVNSILRGGKFICVYDFVRKQLCYYAHNNVVQVEVGDYVKAGQKIAEAGRTGLNAYKKRSPTHLHFTILQIQTDYLPCPINPYSTLINSMKRK